ncbi:MAG: fibronectin type III-like domain-contianing protein, partial [Clostridia bacterium]|nr:fibronectin type III-like domain-contianing protein [Clostridia bacterium]
PFGYGLSYTKFSIAAAESDENGTAVTASVRNDGKYAGDALVQVYVSCDSPYAPVHPRLCGFGHAAVQPGETTRVNIPLDKLTDTVFNDEGDAVKAEHYTLYIGLSQPDPDFVRMSGAEPAVIRK